MIRRSREPMTVSQLKRSMDRRFDRVDRRFERIDRRFERIDRRFERIDRRIGDVVKTLRGEMVTLRSDLGREIADSAAETRRHFDVVAESLRSDIRILAEGIAMQNERLDRHEVRITRLERGTL